MELRLYEYNKDNPSVDGDNFTNGTFKMKNEKGETIKEFAKKEYGTFITLNGMKFQPGVVYGNYMGWSPFYYIQDFFSASEYVKVFLMDDYGSEYLFTLNTGDLYK